MEFNLSDYKITTDERQYILYKRGVIQDSERTKAHNVGREKWTPIAHFTRLECALKFIPQNVIKTNDDLCVVMDKLNAIEWILKELLNINKKTVNGVNPSPTSPKPPII